MPNFFKFSPVVLSALFEPEISPAKLKADLRGDRLIYTRLVIQPEDFEMVEQPEIAVFELANFDYFVPEIALPFEGKPPATINRASLEVIAQAQANFPEMELDTIERILYLFGPELSGIGCRVEGRAAVVDLARRIASYHCLLLELSGLPHELEALFNRLDGHLAQSFPFLVEPPQSQHNSLLHFWLLPANLPFIEYMGGPAWLYLAERLRRLKEKSKDYDHSMTSILQAARDMNLYLKTHQPPAYAEIWQNEELGQELLRRLEHFFTTIPNRQALTQSRAETTIQRDLALVKAMLNLPYLGGSGKSRILQRMDYSCYDKPLFPQVFKPFDDDELPDAEWSDTTLASSNSDQLTVAQDLTANYIVTNASSESTILASEADREEIAEQQLEKEGLLRSQYYARLNHWRDQAVLEQHSDHWDEGVISPLALGQLFSAVFFKSDKTVGTGIKLAASCYEDLYSDRLAKLLVLELLLTTGRDLKAILAIEVRLQKPHLRSAYPPFDQLIYVPDENALYTRPLSQRGLPKIIREEPDPKQEPQKHRDWQILAEIIRRAYRPSQELQEVRLHPATRQLLECYYHKEHYAFKGSRNNLGQGRQTLFSPEQFCPPYETKEGLPPEKHLLGYYNWWLQQHLPGEPLVAVARLRKTARVYLRQVGELGPVLGYFESGQFQPELNARLHYAGLEYLTFAKLVNTAQQKILEVVAAEQEASVCQLLPGQENNLPLDLKRRLTLAPVLSSGQAEKGQTVELAGELKDLFYGTGFCPYPEMIKAVAHNLLKTFANLVNLYPASSPALEQLSYNQLQTICLYLTALCSGGRKSELVHSNALALDLSHDPPLLSLHGKRDRYSTEPRTLPLPPRLALLWEVILHIRNLHLTDARQGRALYSFVVAGPYHSGSRKISNRANSSQRNITGSAWHGQMRPLELDELWRNLEAAAKSLGLKDFLFRFHSFRQYLWWWLVRRGVSEEAVEYLLGHQTTGAEILHPFAGQPAGEIYLEVMPHLEALLDEAGFTNEIAEALVLRDYDTLNKELGNPYPGFSDDWRIIENAAEIESETDDEADKENDNEEIESE